MWLNNCLAKVKTQIDHDWKLEGIVLTQSINECTVFGMYLFQVGDKKG